MHKSQSGIEYQHLTLLSYWCHVTHDVSDQAPALTVTAVPETADMCLQVLSVYLDI